MKKTVLTLALFAMVGCGDDEPQPYPYPQPPPGQPTPGPTPTPGGADNWGTIGPLIQDNCALSGCHAGAAFLASESAFLSSNSRARIGNGTMPPQYSPKIGQWGDAEKKRVLKYFDDNR